MGGFRESANSLIRLEVLVNFDDLSETFQMHPTDHTKAECDSKTLMP